MISELYLRNRSDKLWFVLGAWPLGDSWGFIRVKCFSIPVIRLIGLL